MAHYMQVQFAEALGKHFKITDSPSPETLRVHHIAPVGLLVNSGLEVSGNKGTFFGSVSYAVELYDGMTGELLYASISKETAHALMSPRASEVSMPRKQACDAARNICAMTWRRPIKPWLLDKH